jgi:hypothetical protein
MNRAGKRFPCEMPPSGIHGRYGRLDIGDVYQIIRRFWYEVYTHGCKVYWHMVRRSEAFLAMRGMGTVKDLQHFPERRQHAD